MKAIESVPRISSFPLFLESAPSLPPCLLPFWSPVVRSFVRPTFHCANLSGHSFPKSPSFLPPLFLRWERRYIFLPFPPPPASRRSHREIPLHNLSSWRIAIVMVGGGGVAPARRVSSAV